MKVLLIMTRATDYREAFLSELANQVELTVVAQPCELEGLFPPENRSGYKYIEIIPRRRFGFFWQPGLRKVIHHNSWDIVCVTLNLRQLSSLFLFFTSPSFWSKWVWWGHILGKSESKIIKFIKKYMINKASACLTYGKWSLKRLKEELDIEAISFNNTEIKENEFRIGHFTEHQEVRLLFVGRYQSRKKLDRLIELAKSRKDVYIRLVGPGMENLQIPSELIKNGRTATYGRTIGQELNRHFDWADLVVSPGHVGLLVMNAARHGKGIVIDSGSDHAPEFYVAKEAGQPFISFCSQDNINQFIDQVKNNPSLVKKWAKDLQGLAKQCYTVEKMVNTHINLFNEIAKRYKKV